MIDLLICFIIGLIILALVMGVVRAALSLNALTYLTPYSGLIYALFALLAFLVLLDFCMGYGYLGLSHHRVP